jgi:hypothetical protein
MGLGSGRTRFLDFNASRQLIQESAGMDATLQRGCEYCRKVPGNPPIA